MYAFLMMLGGMDTTSGFTGNVLLRLCEDDELRRQLINDPGLITKGTDELLRAVHAVTWIGPHRLPRLPSSTGSHCARATGRS